MSTSTSTSTDTVPGRFAGKTAIVTGAGSGIGRATALRLAREGATVVVADISGARLEELATGNPSPALIPVTADVATGDGVVAVVARAGGRVDALANVAGIMDGFLPPGEIDDQTWERVFAVNVTSMMRLTRAVLPIMPEASLRGSAAGVAYTASKHAVNGLTKSTAFFYKSQGIRANAVVPGGVMTNIEGAFRSEQAAAVVGPVLHATLPSVATAEQVASAITFLLSDDAANINGAILPCDGGWSAI
jgi:NAD(P)-dependent dehydrogenase (short-subunit alcohol dehydrogenase family)